MRTYVSVVQTPVEITSGVGQVSAI